MTRRGLIEMIVGPASERALKAAEVSERTRLSLMALLRAERVMAERDAVHAAERERPAERARR